MDIYAYVCIWGSYIRVHHYDEISLNLIKAFFHFSSLLCLPLLFHQ